MEGSEATAGSPRDVWMRRAGPFYGLLVAARGQTRLPLAPELDPSDEDRERAIPWAPAVGAIIGLGLGFFAAVLGEIGLAAGVVAALLACVWVVAGGGWSELSAARAGDRLLSKRADASADSGGLMIALVIALALSLVVRGAALIGIEPSYWTEALIVCPLVARFVPIAAALTGSLLAMRGRAQTEDQRDDTPSLPVALLIATGVVAAVALIAGGAAGLVALLIALGAGVGSRLLGRGDSDAVLIAAVELAALLCFAASDTYPLL